MKCIVPCAGESSRMSYIPKHLIQIQGKPLLQQVTARWQDPVDGFVFIARKSATYLWEFIPENTALVFQDEPLGLADAVLKAEPFAGDRFVINLGDCLCRGQFETKDFELGLGVWETGDLREVNKSYLVEEVNGLVTRVIEKPNLQKAYPKMKCGMGVYFFDKRLFTYLRAAKKGFGGDFMQAVQTMINAREPIAAVHFTGAYINVTHPEDIAKAEELLSVREINTCRS